MQIAIKRVIGIHYTISVDELGVVFSNFEFEPEEYVHGARSIFPMVANALEGHRINDQIKVTLPPQHAYGLIKDEMIYSLPNSLFENIPSFEIGNFIQVPGGVEAKLLQKNKETILVDTNHPLAGIYLHYHIKVISIRQASDYEIEMGISESAIKSCNGTPNCC